MASAISHFVVGMGLALPALRSTTIKRALPPWAILLSAGVLAAAPDVDTLLMSALEIPYNSVLGHRGLLHSAPFLVVVNSLLAWGAARGSWPAVARLAALWSCCALSHPLMDMLTNGGLGVMLWYPFSEHRLFFGWRPIRVAPLGVRRFFSQAAYVLKSEAPFDLAAWVIGIAGWLLVRRAVLPEKRSLLSG